MNVGSQPLDRVLKHRVVSLKRTVMSNEISLSHILLGGVRQNTQRTAQVPGGAMASTQQTIAILMDLSDELGDESTLDNLLVHRKELMNPAE